ncbi:hypothetical protein EJB05_17614 [Eragrostis curvula]|uniref:Uncharacterized protein n=1 Tax=Eragrostis curvula TaxID=38414 RepID=A0A5J9VHU6_9POAL|nr:hypothetical protein EJB05_17614 [Eragrostis curvula]
MAGINASDLGIEGIDAALACAVIVTRARRGRSSRSAAVHAVAPDLPARTPAASPSSIALRAHRAVTSVDARSGNSSSKHLVVVVLQHLTGDPPRDPAGRHLALWWWSSWQLILHHALDRGGCRIWNFPIEFVTSFRHYEKAPPGDSPRDPAGGHLVVVVLVAADCASRPDRGGCRETF